MEELRAYEMFDTEHTAAKELLQGVTYPWEALPLIGQWIVKLGAKLPAGQYDEVSEHVWIAKSAKIYPYTSITGPAIIGENTEVRPGAFIRGNALVGENCVVGNSTELKNVILFDNVQVPHYNYVGDSILGYKAHMGAGAVTSNVKQDKSLISVNKAGERVETGLKKFGAMLGDHAEIGCSSVLNPGSVIGRYSRVYPLSMVRGFVPPNSIHKNDGSIVPVR